MTESYIKQLKKLRLLANKAKQQPIAGVLGRTEPYLPTRPSSGYTCPATFSKATSQPVTDITTHWENIGLGNNMVLFRHIFEEVGEFKEWLGPGSIGEGADDGEFVMRCLIAGYEFHYNDKLKVYHNKWLSEPQAKKQHLIYSCGGLSQYGFYFFQGVKACGPELHKEITYVYDRIVENLRMIKKHPRFFYAYIQPIFENLYCLAKGLWLAVVFAWLVPIPEKERLKKFTIAGSI